MPMMAAENYSKIGVLSSIYQVGKSTKTQQVYGSATIYMPIVEAMTHNKKDVSS
jgi:hypothetical protein